MTALVKITVREQIGERIHVRTAEGDTFDAALDELRKLRAEPVPVLLAKAPEVIADACVEKVTF